MSRRKNKQEMIKRAKIRLDDEAFLAPSQIVKEFCEEHGIDEDELNKVFRWFSDPMGNYIYFITKNCDLDIMYLKARPHKEIVSFLLDYIDEFNQIVNEENCFAEKMPYLKIKETDFLNKKIYFVSCCLVDRVYKKEFFHTKKEGKIYRRLL